MKSSTLQVLLLALFLLGIGISAQATPLTLDNCGSCLGSDISLDITTSDGGATYDVILKLDSTNYTGGGGDSIVQAGFKAFKGLDGNDILAFSASSGSWDDSVLAGVSSNGYCTAGGEPGFLCSIGEANIANSPGEYTFTYKIDGSNVKLLDEWTIRFQYCDSATFDGGEGDCNGSIISEPGRPGDPGTPVPEPSAALVFAAGLLAAAPKLRRRR